MYSSEVLDLGIKETRSVIAAIQQGHGDNFSDFNLGILGRRFALAMSRMGIRQTENLCTVLAGGDEDFYMRFIEELQPPTTELFRDPSFWLHLRDAILRPFAAQQIRVRILQAAFDTGEELYSLLVMLSELGLLNKVSISSVYLSKSVLSRIKSGVLPARRREIDEANYQRLSLTTPYEQYVSCDEETPSFKIEYMQGVTFLRQGPEYQKLSDEKYHLILCRNQFLYFNPQLGTRNMCVLFESLYGGGVIALGTKESLESYQNGSTFTVLNSEESLYRKRL